MILIIIIRRYNILYCFTIRMKNITLYIKKNHWLSYESVKERVLKRIQLKVFLLKKSECKTDVLSQVASPLLSSTIQIGFRGLQNYHFMSSTSFCMFTRCKTVSLYMLLNCFYFDRVFLFWVLWVQNSYAIRILLIFLKI